MLDKRLVFFFFFEVILVSISAVEINKNSNYVSFPANENGTCFKRVPYDDALAQNISMGIVKLASGSQQPGVKTSKSGWVTIIDCCDGFIRDNSTGKCETHCDEGCFGGMCTGPNICTCPDGWQAKSGVCNPICRRPCPENSYCFSPDFCTCKFGYEEVDGICQPVCLHDCRNGNCVAPRECRCYVGFVLNETKHCDPICESGCPNGICNAPNVCTCNSGYINPPDTRATCTPFCPDGCDNGDCISPGVCKCKQGYIRGGYTSGSCEPQCQDGCINGRCIAPDQCTCNPGFIMDSQSRTCIAISKGVKDQSRIQATGGYENLGNAYSPYDQNSNRVPSDTLNRNQEGLRYQGSIQNHDNLSPGKAHGTQGIILNRNRETDQKNSQEVNRLNGQNQNSNTTSHIYKINEYNQTHRIQGSFVPSQPYPSRAQNHLSDLRGGNYPYRISETNQTNKQEGTFIPFESFPSQGYNQSSNVLNSNDPYKNNRYNQSHRPQGPFAPLGPHPTQETHTTQTPMRGQGPYQINDPYGNYKPTQTQSPSGVDGINGQNQNPYQQQGHTNTQGLDQNQGNKQNPYQQGPYTPEGHNQNPYQQQGPHISQGLGQNQEHNQNSYQQGPHRQAQPLNNDGIKTSHTRPSADNVYGKPQINRPPGYAPGIDLSYGVNEMYNNPQNNMPFRNVGPIQVQGTPFDLHNPTDTFYAGLVELGPNSAVNQFALCQIPCLNGECIGPNVCACKSGHGPDPHFANVCVPICQGGCLNGICSAPNLCICNPGFVKEQGIKGAQRCVPIY